jgi:PPIC-type peptidyl-prolyl cis-trans isomerase-like protein
MAQGNGVGPGNRKTIRFVSVLTLCGSGLFCAFLFGQSTKPDESARPKEIALQVIVVNSPEQADQVLERLKAGYDFASLAKEESIGPTADSGGYMGRMDPKSLRPELRDALAGVRPGQISGVTRIPSGYAILKVLPESKAGWRASIHNGQRGEGQSCASQGCAHELHPRLCKRGGFALSYPLSPVRVDGIADTARKKGPPPWALNLSR